MKSRRVLALALLALASGPVAAPSPAAAAAPLTPYVPPPFGAECTVHQFAEGEVPRLGALPDDPLCVEYAKRDITLSNGGAVRFLLAEPARFALAGTKCRYWQQDHWSVQLRPGQTPLVRWDGSYWWDLGSGQFAARLTGLRIAGRPFTIEEGARYIERISPALAAYFRVYGQGGDGGSVRLGATLDPRCT